MSGDYFDADQVAVGRARLIKEVTANWTLLPMFPQVRVALAMASGANLRGAYRVNNPPLGWCVGENGRLTEETT